MNDENCGISFVYKAVTTDPTVHSLSAWKMVRGYSRGLDLKDFNLEISDDGHQNLSACVE